MSATGYVYDERTLLHRETRETRHPERPLRLRAIVDNLRDTGLLQRCVLVPTGPASSGQRAPAAVPGRQSPCDQALSTLPPWMMRAIESVHTPSHINWLAQGIPSDEEACSTLSETLDSLYVCPESATSAIAAAEATARLACAIALSHPRNAASRLAASGEPAVRNGFALVRPPGHHASPDCASGFCLVNNVAVAVRAVQSRGLARRVLVVDWDVHHGNGTQRVFAEDPNVLFVSIHRYDRGRFYPGDAAAAGPAYVGEGSGRGFSVNVAWNMGNDRGEREAGDADYAAAMAAVVLPLGRAFAPDLVVVSAGFDAALGDPIGACSVTAAGFGRMTHMLSELAGGRLLLVLEGGYRRTVISACAEACMRVLIDGSSGLEVVELNEAARSPRFGSPVSDDEGATWSPSGRPRTRSTSPPASRDSERDLAVRAGPFREGPSAMALAAIAETLRCIAPFWPCIRPHPRPQPPAVGAGPSGSLHTLSSVASAYWRMQCREALGLCTLPDSVLRLMERTAPRRSRALGGRSENESLAASVESVEDRASRSLSLLFGEDIHVSPEIAKALVLDAQPSTASGNSSPRKSRRERMPRTVVVFLHETGQIHAPGAAPDTTLVDARHTVLHTPFAPLIAALLGRGPLPEDPEETKRGSPRSSYPSERSPSPRRRFLSQADEGSASSPSKPMDTRSLGVVDLCVRAHRWRLRQSLPSGSPSENASLEAVLVSLWDVVLAHEHVERVFFVASGLPAYAMMHLFQNRFHGSPGNAHASVERLVAGAALASPTMFLPVAVPEIATWYQSHSLVIVPTRRPVGTRIATQPSFGTCVSAGTDDPSDIGAVIAAQSARILSFLAEGIRR